MAGGSDLSAKKWDIVKEQLNALNALNKAPKQSECIGKILSEDISLKNITSQVIISVCYFLLGIVDHEEREKLIKWPLINIQTHTKFRKGLSVMVTNFQEKYPWANLMKLPESYFVNPHNCQKKLIDFILRLTNLAIHVALNDPELLVMHSGTGLNNKETDIIREVVISARQYEESEISKNVFPIKEFEKVKIDVSDKCIALKQENDEVEVQLSNLTKCAVKDGLISPEKNGIEALKNLKNQKLSEVEKLNDQLGVYHRASQDLLHKLKALRNPTRLCAKDFGCDNSSVSLSQATIQACENLHQLYKNMVSGCGSKEDEEELLRQLILIRDSLQQENETLKSFILKASPVSER